MPRGQAVCPKKEWHVSVTCHTGSGNPCVITLHRTMLTMGLVLWLACPEHMEGTVIHLNPYILLISLVPYYPYSASEAQPESSRATAIH